jgi:uncharacterized protein YjiS (DUF1127 family)
MSQYIAHWLPAPAQPPIRAAGLPLSWLATAHVLWRRWRQRNEERQQIMRFTDRELQDAGLTRGDVFRELARPFWANNHSSQ